MFNLCMPDENYLYAGSFRRIKIWDKDKFEGIKILEKSSGAISSVFVNKKNIYASFFDNSIKVWKKTLLKLIIRKIPIDKEFLTLVGHNKPATKVLADKNNIYTASYDQTIKIWNKKKGTIQYTLKGHKLGVSDLAIDKDFLYSSSLDGLIIVWKL